MNELPPQPTPQQSYGQQDSQQSHHHNMNRKYPQQSHQIPQKVTYRPPPQQQQQQVPPQQQYQQYSSSPHQEYFQQAPAQNYQQSGQYAPGPQYSNQQQHVPPQAAPVQQYANQQPPANYQHRPSYTLPPPSQQQIYQQQQQQYQAPHTSNGNYSKRNASKESVESSKTTSSSKQKLESELRIVFEKVDTNRSGRISAKELSYALLNFDRTRFQDSTIRLMINLFSTSDSSSKSLTFEQFVSLWKYLSAYKKLFIQADANKSGDISFGEFQKILEQIGYKLDIDLVLHLFQKYAMHENGGIGKLKFDNFIELLVYLRKLTDVFKKYDKDLSGTATISFSSFLFEVSNLN